MNTNYKILPQELLSVGINLESLGIGEIAWKYEDVFVVIDFLFRKGHPILGGDVYVYNKDTIEITCDGWYLNEADSKDFIKESKNKAIEYINNYRALNGVNYVYSITY